MDFPAPITGEQEALVPESRQPGPLAGDLSAEGEERHLSGTLTEGKGANCAYSSLASGGLFSPCHLCLAVQKGDWGVSQLTIPVTQVTLVR